MLASMPSLGDVLKCKIEGDNEDIFITTSPDTNQNDGQYARIGTSPHEEVLLPCPCRHIGTKITPDTSISSAKTGQLT
ncbi:MULTISPECIES: hypothetical protein [Bradyrhizobium]|uniref:hypothetical protein n=1 Tax=Bradyrhizobium elkanii TaxID=29448 RepID=UPI0003F5F8C1|nr:hypothetical protein [Bradyrhizobium elkanii]